LTIGDVGSVSAEDAPQFESVARVATVVVQVVVGGEYADDISHAAA
jgi:hypothetical protein